MKYKHYLKLLSKVNKTHKDEKDILRAEGKCISCDILMIRCIDPCSFDGDTIECPHCGGKDHYNKDMYSVTYDTKIRGMRVNVTI